MQPSDPTPPTRTEDANEPLEAAEDDYSDERHQLAMVIHDGGCQCRGHTLGWTIRSRDSLQLADAVLAAGYVRAEDAEVHVLEKTLAASREHARRARREGLDEGTCRFWSGVSGFLRSRIRALKAGEEPDWSDAANSAVVDLDDGRGSVSGGGNAREGNTS